MSVYLFVCYVLMCFVSYVFGIFFALTPFAMNIFAGSVGILALLAGALVAVGIFFSDHVLVAYGEYDPGLGNFVVHMTITAIVSGACFGLGLGARSPLLLIVGVGISSAIGYTIPRGLSWLEQRNG